MSSTIKDSREKGSFQREKGGEEKGRAPQNKKKQQQQQQQPTHDFFKSSKPKSAKDEICILNYGAGTAANFVNFQRDIQVVAGREFGDLFSFVITDEYPKESDPVLGNWQKEINQEIDSINRFIGAVELLMAPYSENEENEAAILKEYENKIESYKKSIKEIKTRYENMSVEEKAEYNDVCRESWRMKLKAKIDRESKRQADKPKLYWLIRGNMSVESLEKVKEYMGQNWITNEKEQDPLILWRAIKTTHTAYFSGVSEIDQQVVRQQYHEMKMGPRDTPTKHKERMDTALNAMRSLGMSIPDERHLAADYISTLDSRFAEMKTTLNNNVTAGIGRYPSTLLEAYQIANNWKRTTTYQGVTTSVFAATVSDQKTTSIHKDTKKKANDGKRRQDATKLNDGSKKEFQGTCIKFGRPGHKAKESPNAELIKRALEENEESARALTTFTSNSNSNSSSNFVSVLRTTSNPSMRSKILLMLVNLVFIVA